MPVEIKQPQLASYENKPYFFADTYEYVEFMAPANGATTSGSANPRSELREMNGSNLASWNGGSGTHTLELTLAFIERPKRSDGKNPVVGGQVHNGDDDVTVCRLHGPNVYATRDDTVDHMVLIPNYVLGTYFTLKMTATSAGIRYHINGVDKGLVTWPGSKSGAYFKAGCYTQANPSNGGSGRGVVRIKRNSLKVTHV
jgi:poly(beta-D-mannuronate) lyase